MSTPIHEKGKSGQNVLIESILTRPTIFEAIFSYLSPANFIRFARTCRLARDAITLFYASTFNINRHLSRFFINSTGFRSLQARTGTLISGSNALQFLDRTFYPESDLDLYVHPGHAREVGEWLIQKEGYLFVPKPPHEAQEFHQLDWPETRAPWSDNVPKYSWYHDTLHVERYRVQGLDEIYHFEKQPACVMNFIAFDAAYSLYPRATFEERRALAFNSLGKRAYRALGKYHIRGWSIMCNDLPSSLSKFRASLNFGRVRTTKDSLAWVMPLDLTGVKLRSRMSPSSQVFTWDPTAFNSWTLVDEFNKCVIKCHVVRPPVFRYAYLVAHKEFVNKVTNFLGSQAVLQHEIVCRLPDDQKEPSWAWWDACFPEYFETYLNKHL